MIRPDEQAPGPENATGPNDLTANAATHGWYRGQAVALKRPAVALTAT